MTPEEARKAAVKYVIREGNRNSLVLPDGTRVGLAWEPTTELSKAQWTDATWIVEQILIAGSQHG